MSLEVRITLEPKAWLRFLDKLAAANMMHEFNAIEAGYNDAKRSKELATIQKNKRQQRERMAGMTLPSRVDV